MLQDRRVVSGMLPYDYEVEYLEASGTQYILTDLYPDNNTDFEIKYFLNKTYVDTSLKSSCIVAERNGGNPNNGTHYGFATWSSGQFYFGKNWYNNFGGTSLNKTHIIKTDLSNNSSAAVIVDGVRKNYGVVSTFKAPISAALFAMNEGNRIREFTSGRIYYAIFKNCKSNKTLAHFIPVIDKQGVPAMYDKISKTLYYNRGTGSFTVGPRKNRLINNETIL